jgi:hypothetical protein
VDDRTVELRPYQREALAWMSARAWRATLALMPMGQGMAVTATKILVFVCDEPHHRPAGRKGGR